MKENHLFSLYVALSLLAFPVSRRTYLHIMKWLEHGYKQTLSPVFGLPVARLTKHAVTPRFPYGLGKDVGCILRYVPRRGRTGVAHVELLLGGSLLDRAILVLPDPGTHIVSWLGKPPWDATQMCGVCA
jgi:hypothetical protein